MREIVNSLHENRQIELAKSILESHGYTVTKKIRESEIDYKTLDGLLTSAQWDNSYDTYMIALDIAQEKEAKYLLSQGYEEGRNSWAKYPYDDEEKYRVFYKREGVGDRELFLELDGSIEVGKIESESSGPIDFDKYATEVKKVGKNLQKIGFICIIERSGIDFAVYVEMTSDGKVVDATNNSKTRGKTVEVTYDSAGRAHGKILGDVEDKSSKSQNNSNRGRDHEEFVSYNGGKYAKDLKRHAGYVVYKGERNFLGYADTPAEAERMIDRAR